MKRIILGLAMTAMAATAAISMTPRSAEACVYCKSDTVCKEVPNGGAGYWACGFGTGKCKGITACSGNGGGGGGGGGGN